LDNDRVKSVHLDDVFCIQRWIKRLEQARQSDSDTLDREVDRIIREMNDRSNQYSAMSTKEREDVVKLAQQPEYLLNKY
jgi:hypothetical protein